MRYFLLTFLITLFLIPENIRAQQRSFFCIEPNIMLANRAFRKSRFSDYLYPRNSFGTGLNAGYSRDLNKHFYIGGLIQLCVLRSSVDIDFEGSGFNALTGLNFERERYTRTYMTIVGLTLTGGYRIWLNEHARFEIAPGIHLNAGMLNSISQFRKEDTRSQNGVYPMPVFEEQLNDQASVLMPGGDIFLNYIFRIRRRSFLIGLHYSYTPGRLEGGYIAFPDFDFGVGSGQELSRSYMGFNIGVGLRDY